MHVTVVDNFSLLKNEIGNPSLLRALKLAIHSSSDQTWFELDEKTSLVHNACTMRG